jgi:outer membrane protein insertion porin family
MPKVRNSPPLVGYAWLALFCVAVIFGGSLVFSDGNPQPASKQEQEKVVEVRIKRSEGNDRIPIEKIARHIHTRAGRPYEPEMIEEDVRRLHRTRMFTDVKASTQQVAGGRVVIFEVHERPVLESVKYVGNEKIKRKQLVKETGLKAGDPMDPYAVEEGRRKIEEYYRSKGFSKVQVTLVEGSQPTDRRAIYLIDEGPKERVLWTQFVGNTIASDARLTTQIKAKPGFFWFFGGTVDPKQIDEDINRLTAYYRSLGFFQARVGRELHWNEDHNWLTLTFVIHEGIRYKVRNVTLIGNKKFPTSQLTQDIKLTPGKYFNQSEMMADVLKMQDIYGGEGYVFADVKADPRFLEEPGQIDLVYNIKEGARYRVGRINFQIKGEYPHTKITTLLDRTSVHPGQIADVREFRASERRVKASQIFSNDITRGETPKLAYSPPGAENAETEVADDAPRPSGARPSRRPGGFRGQSPDSEQAEASAQPREILRLQDAGYDPGGGHSLPQMPSSSAPAGQPLGTIAPGLDRRAPSGLLAAPPQAPAAAWPPPPTNAVQTNPPAYPGATTVSAPDFWNRQGLDAMSPLTGQPPYEEPPIDLPLNWQVADTTTGRFMFSVGVNSDLGLVGSVIIDEQNFDWTRFPQSWDDIRNATAFRGAGQRLRIEAMPGTVLQRYTVNFTEPYLFNTGISLGLSGYYYDRWFIEWSERRIGGRVATGYQLRPDFSATIAYRGESIALFNPEKGRSGVVPPEIAAAVGEHSLHSFRGALTYDTRDNAFLATEGWLIETGFEQAIGSYVYPRGDLDIRKYFLLHQRPDGSGRHVLSLSTRMGITGDNTPVYENFFAGGFSTIRGFYFRNASPRDDGVVVGGKFMLLASAEYMFPITADDTLRGVVFCDTGTVEPTINHWTDRYRAAPGFGLRITIPAMGPAPIALDFAFPVSKNPGDRQEMFSFFIGFLR